MQGTGCTQSGLSKTAPSRKNPSLPVWTLLFASRQKKKPQIPTNTASRCVLSMHKVIKIMKVNTPLIADKHRGENTLDKSLNRMWKGSAEVKENWLHFKYVSTMAPLADCSSVVPRPKSFKFQAPENLNTDYFLIDKIFSQKEPFFCASVSNPGSSLFAVLIGKMVGSCSVLELY